MPAKSKAQFRKMFVLFQQGKISRAELNDFIHGVDYKNLPARKKRRNRRARKGGR